MALTTLHFSNFSLLKSGLEFFNYSRFHWIWSNREQSALKEKKRGRLSVADYRSRNLHEQFNIEPYAHIQVLLFLVLSVFCRLFWSLGDMPSKEIIWQWEKKWKKQRDELVESQRGSVDNFFRTCRWIDDLFVAHRKLIFCRTILFPYNHDVVLRQLKINNLRCEFCSSKNTIYDI